MNTETAISDLVAVMALIAVFVTAVAILGVTLLSHPPGDAAPAMIARSTVEDGNLSLSHDGGDPLVRGHFAILVDGVDRTDEFKLTDTSGIKHDTWTSWETGEALVLSGVPEGAHIQIVGEGVIRTGSEWLLHGLGTVEPTVVPTTAEPTVVPTTTVPTTEPTPTPVPLVANFAANVTSGFSPLTVQFTDTSTGGPTSWLWTFGDGTTSTVQNPVHTYTAPGTYTVSLTVNNAFNTTSVTKLNYIVVTKKSLFDETIFIYGKTLKFSGNTINAPGATAIITEGLNTNDLNGGASVAVSNLYFDDGVNLNGGSASLGSKERPGVIYVNGDLTLVNGQRHVYGDVYVNGDFDLKDARIHGNVYVNGDLTLDWTPQLDDGSRIYYTGRLTKPDSYNADLLAKCIHNASVPKLDMPDIEFPSAKPASWYTERGYATDGTLISNIKIFVDSYSSTSWRPTATDVIIIARTGDITITGIGGSGVTGVFFAPNGKVTFEGKFLEGLVIARDGFFVTSGGTTVTFKPISHYIASSGDYPFEQG